MNSARKTQDLRQYHAEIIRLNIECGWGYERIAKHFFSRKRTIEWIVKQSKSGETQRVESISVARAKRQYSKKSDRFNYLETPDNVILPKGA